MLQCVYRAQHCAWCGEGQGAICYPYSPTHTRLACLDQALRGWLNTIECHLNASVQYVQRKAIALEKYKGLKY